MAGVDLFVRAGGSASNGGSSSGTSPDRTGTDGVTNGTTTFTSATAAFTAGDVDKLINITTKNRYRIVGYTNSTTVTLNQSPTAGSGLTWNIGGAVSLPGALLSASASLLVNGDAIWIGAGTYREANITFNSTPTAEITINGDVDGAKTGDAGAVILTAYTTNDKTAPATTPIWIFDGKNYLTLRKLMVVGPGSSACWRFNTGSHDIKIEDCAFVQGGNSGDPSSSILRFTSTYNVPQNVTIDRCRFARLGSSINEGVIGFTLTTGAGADYDTNAVIRNCTFYGGNSYDINVIVSGTAAGHGGGVDIINCTSIGANSFLVTAATYVSTTYPCTVNNCFIYHPGVGSLLKAGTAGQITENYNILWAFSARTNVTAGANSISDGSYAPLFHFGQERIWGSPLFKPFGEPMQSSPLLGFGNDGTQTAYDLLNLQRPAGGASASPAVGAMERHNNWGVDPSPIGTGASAIKITGPGDQAFILPLRASVAVTISVVVKWDATYAGTKPQLEVQAQGTMGVAAETKTATGSSGSNETLTLTQFTPSAAGQVVVRVKSNDTNGAGVVQADSFSVAT